MIALCDCEKIPSSAPTIEKVGKSKSKKVLKLNGMYFFVAETKGLTKIYSIDLGIKLLATHPKSHAMNCLVKRLHLVKEVIDDTKSIV